MVADAVAVKPVSATKFPANREKNREFFKFGLARCFEFAVRPMIQANYREFPYATEQGNYFSEQGIWTAPSRVNREFHP